MIHVLFLEYSKYLRIKRLFIEFTFEFVFDSENPHTIFFRKFSFFGFFQELSLTSAIMKHNDRHDRNWFRFRRIFRFVTENESFIIFYYIRLKSDIPMKSDNHIYNRKSDDSSSIWLNPFLAQPFFGFYLGTKVRFTNLSHDEDSRYWIRHRRRVSKLNFEFRKFRKLYLVMCVIYM